MKVIIGIGDSWTVGEGSVEILDKDLDPQQCIQLQNKKSWLSILRSKYYPDHHVINMAMPGFSNRAAIKNLYFLNTELRKQITSGYLIFLLSEALRFSFLNTDIQAHDLNKFRTMMPRVNHPFSDTYFELVHSENSCVAETMLAIIEAQNYAVMHNLKFIFASGFDSRGLSDYKKFPVLLDQLDISKFLNNHTDYESFDQLLRRLEKKYNIVLHAPCCHPNSEGYQIIADEMHKFMVTVG